MPSIYLCYRNSLSDPWTGVPSLTSVFSAQPAGSLPAANIRLQSAPETETPCGCPGGSATDDHYILRAEIAPMPQSTMSNIMMFLLRFKQASYHEVQYANYASGSITSVGLSLLECKNENGMSTVYFYASEKIFDGAKEASPDNQQLHTLLIGNANTNGYGMHLGMMLALGERISFFIGAGMGYNSVTKLTHLDLAGQLVIKLK